MRCLKCLSTIDASNKATFKLGVRLPYCKPCIDQYVARKKFKAFTSAQRKLYVESMRVKIADASPYTSDEVHDAKLRMYDIGLSDDEIVTVLSGAVIKD